MSFIKVPSSNHCPGIDEYIRPTVSYGECEKCSGRVEYWSDEDYGLCIDCEARHEKKDEKPSCLEYCDYADVCKGIIMSKRR